MTSFFVCGTDTGVGKTFFTGFLANYFLNNGFSVVTQKWVQTGSKGFSQDILAHLKIMGKSRRYVKGIEDLVCPFSFHYPSSPHFAAELDKRKINIDKIKNSYRLLSKMFDVVVVEGVGGALVPLTKKFLLLDLVKELRIPVILVIANKLGAINHTILTFEAIRSRKLDLCALIFNSFGSNSPKKIQENNITTLIRFANLYFSKEIPHATI